jgi:hypothetical protein
MRYDDLWNTGESNIPDRDKRPAFGFHKTFEIERCKFGKLFTLTVVRVQIPQI